MKNYTIHLPHGFCFVTCALILMSSTVFASNSITPIDAKSTSAHGCLSAKIDTLHYLANKCTQGHIEGISCSTQDHGSNEYGNFCTATCSAYCIEHD